MEEEMANLIERMPKHEELYNFLRENYVTSRFESSPHKVSFPDYTHIVTKSKMESLAEYGFAGISPFESRTGSAIYFDAALNLIPSPHTRVV